MTEREWILFGYQFIQNNINNMNQIINEKELPLVQEHFLKEGENNIKLCIKNKLTNLSKMFENCKYIWYRWIKIIKYQRCFWFFWYTSK